MIVIAVVAQRAVLVVLAVLAFAFCIVGCSNAFDDAACTLDALSYPISVARDVPIAFTEAPKLKVEACAIRDGQSPTCAEVAAVANAAGDSYALGSATDSFQGTLTQNSANQMTKLAVTIQLGEGAPSSTTTVQVRVLDDTETELFKTSGPVHWSSDSCHPKPDVTAI